MNIEKTAKRTKLRLVCPSCCQQVEADETRCPHDGHLLYPVENCDPLIGTTVGAYEIQDEIGEGNCGRVYRGQHNQSNSIVAIKVLKCGFTADPAAVKRFQQEAQALVQLAHENIPAVFDFGLLPDGRPFIVMEYVSGKTLLEILESERRLQDDAFIKLFIEISDVISSAHQAGILHRDIKPSNIIIDESGTTRVVDFGLAKMAGLDTSATVTRTGAVQGTPAYMSPEQCYGLHVDERSDVYSLGCVMYECLTGTQVFPSENAFRCMHDQVFKAPPLVSKHIEGISEHLEALVMACLAKDPEDRFQSMAEVREALNQLRSENCIQFAYIRKSLRKLKGGTKRKAARSRRQLRGGNSNNQSKEKSANPLGAANYKRLVDAGRRMPILVSTMILTAILFGPAFLWTAYQGQALTSTIVPDNAGEIITEQRIDPWDVDPIDLSAPYIGGSDSSEAAQNRLDKLGYQGVWRKEGRWTQSDDPTILGALNCEGPIEAKTKLINFPAFAAASDKGAGKWFLINDESLGIYDSKKNEVEVLPLEPRLRTPASIAYDTKRKRVLMLSSHVDDRLFFFEAATDTWFDKPARGARNGLMRGIVYSPSDDKMYTLVRDVDGKNTATYLSKFDAEGRIESSVRLSRDLCSLRGWSAAKVTLTCEGDYLIATLFRTESLHDHDMTPRMFVIDRESGEVLYGRTIYGADHDHHTIGHAVPR